MPDPNELREKQRRMKIEELLRDSNLPKRHLSLISKGGEDHPWTRSLKIIKDGIAHNAGSMFGICGRRGNGKTQLAVEAARECISLGISSFYITAIGFFSRIKATYRKDSEESEAAAIDELRRYKLLIIDEVGKRSDSAWENNLLFELINHRYNDATDTIMIDNRSKDEFLAGLGASIASRMLETGGVIEADWEPWRK